MHIKRMKGSLQAIIIRNWHIYFSYETPIVVYNRETGKVYSTMKRYSPTTDRHMKMALNHTGEDDYVVRRHDDITELVAQIEYENK